MRRRNERIGRVILLAVTVVLSVSDSAFAFTGRTEITGRLAVGETRYELRGIIERPLDSATYVVDLTLGIGGKQVREIHLAVSPTSATLRVGDTIQRLPKAIAVRWFEQLETDVLILAEGQKFERRTLPDGLIALDATQPLMISPGVEGRIRLRYAQMSDAEHLGPTNHSLCPRCRLLGVEFYSLAEWANDFGEYVAFTMNFEGGKP